MTADTTNTAGSTRRFPWVSALLGIGLAGAIGMGVQQHSNLVNLRMQMNGVEREMATLRQTLGATDTTIAADLTALRESLEKARKESGSASAEAKALARRQSDLLAARLAKAQEEHNATKAAISQELTNIKSSAEQASTKLTDITSEVGTVKTEVASTRSELDKTIAELKRTTGDMGVMSGLIATNGKEIDALRQLGERDYFEFTINKNQKLQKIGDIQIAVKKADAKRNRFTIEILADDKRVEKKDRTVNEPVQFYAAKARLPYEVVINEVKKDTVTGYLSTPKVKLARR